MLKRKYKRMMRALVRREQRYNRRLYRKGKVNYYYKRRHGKYIKVGK